MVQFPPKKGPRMTVASEMSNRTRDFGQDEMDAALNALVFKTQNAIERVRSQMTDAEREEADRRALAILKTANSAAGSSQKIA